MGKIIDFGQFRNEQEPALAVERTENFYSTARELSDFIAALPISREENDRLIALIIQQVQDGEQGAFAQGLRIGKEFATFKRVSSWGVAFLLSSRAITDCVRQAACANSFCVMP